MRIHLESSANTKTKLGSQDVTISRMELKTFDGRLVTINLTSFNSSDDLLELVKLKLYELKDKSL